ncbi:hypothetical protein J6590_045847 [Homalodisca vitripennis]|nr:hypothetical protein J6590_045847 [Homalodisca vitripennis]
MYIILVSDEIELRYCGCEKLRNVSTCGLLIKALLHSAPRHQVRNKGPPYSPPTHHSAAKTDMLLKVGIPMDGTKLASPSTKGTCLRLMGNAFAHGVWDSLADYPVNPLRATEGQAGTLLDDILPGVSQASVFTLLMKDRMYMSGDCIPGVLTLQHHLHNGVCRNIANCGGERSPGLCEAPANEEGVMNNIIFLRAVSTVTHPDYSITQGET